MTAHTKNWVNSPRVQYTADGLQTVFDFSFPIFEDADLEVYVASTLNDHIVDYTVSGADTSAGGSVSFNTAPANGNVVTLRRKTPIDSTNDLETLTATVQETEVEQERSLHLDATDPDGDMTLPDKATRSGKFLKFDATGNPEAVDSTTSYTVSPFMETMLDDVDAATARSTLGLGTAAVENVAAGGTGDLLRADGDGSSLTGVMKDLIDDTTPQLGGDLDPNGHVIGWNKGVDIASASPLVLGTDGNYFDVTGTTGFSAITVAANTMFMLQFDGVLTMTHGASLNLPGGADITTAAGDEAILFATAANTVRVVSYTKADGTAVSGSGSGGGSFAGEIRQYLGISAPSGWLILNGDTIGSAASGATHAHADYETLYTLFWDSMADAQAPVSSGRGASAAADFAANKTLTMVDARGRVTAGTGSGSMTTHGATGGAETHTLTTAQMPAHTHDINTTQEDGGGTRVDQAASAGGGIYTTTSTGGGGSHNNLQPWLALNFIIKT